MSSAPSTDVGPVPAGSRVFRATVTIEIIVLAAPGIEITHAADGLLQAKVDGDYQRVDFEALIRDAVNDADVGTDLWTVSGESAVVSPVEELVASG